MVAGGDEHVCMALPPHPPLPPYFHSEKVNISKLKSSINYKSYLHVRKWREIPKHTRRVSLPLEPVVASLHHGAVDRFAQG